MHPAPGAAHTNQRWQQASFSVLSAQPGLFTCMQKQWSGCLLQHAYRTRKHAQPALLPVMSMLPPAACTACGAYLASRPDHCVTKRHRFSCRVLHMLSYIQALCLHSSMHHHPDHSMNKVTPNMPDCGMDKASPNRPHTKFSFVFFFWGRERLLLFMSVAFMFWLLLLTMYISMICHYSITARPLLPRLTLPGLCLETFF